MSSNTSRFFKLELGEGSLNVERAENLHVAKQVENLSGLAGDKVARKAMVDELVEKYDIKPPPMELEKSMRELRSRMWAEEDRKEWRERQGVDPLPKWTAPDRDPVKKLKRRNSWWTKLRRRFGL